MEIMNPTEFLERTRRGARSIDTRLAAIDKLNERIYGCADELPNNSTIASFRERVSREREKLGAELAEYETAYFLASDFISKIPGDGRREVFALRFLKSLKWEEVANLTYFSKVHCQRIVREVLKTQEGR